MLRCALAFLTLVAVYVLSTGPVVKLVCRHTLPTRALRIYCPLHILNETPGIREVWNWYLYDLWKLPMVEVPEGFNI